MLTSEQAERAHIAAKRQRALHVAITEAAWVCVETYAWQSKPDCHIPLRPLWQMCEEGVMGARDGNETCVLIPDSMTAEQWKEFCLADIEQLVIDVQLTASALQQITSKPAIEAPATTLLNAAPEELRNGVGER